MGQHISQVFAPGHPPTIVPPVGAPGFGAGKPPTIPHLPTTKQNSNPTNQNTPPPHTSTTPTPDAPNPPPDPTSTTAATEASPPADPSPPGNSIPPADSIVPTSTLITGGATSVAPLSAADSSAASDGNTESSQIPLLNEPQSSRGSTSNGAGDSGTTAPLSPFPTGTQTTTLSDGIVTTETQYGTPSGASTTPIPSIQSASSKPHVNTTAISRGRARPFVTTLPRLRWLSFVQAPPTPTLTDANGSGRTKRSLRPVRPSGSCSSHRRVGPASTTRRRGTSNSMARGPRIMATRILSDLIKAWVDSECAGRRWCG
ncbi:hypothetical protein FB45DRAFT_70642 [Roridomyces roridus]|uniref:Uncharacterized protein n=1 Tax=Roridomyces roridus TaxID=1738132 RepID=A0AAD7BMQ0_9AGAR|nr:hypothetical protein FB45DRAFT_70642 [Roridomyces roridus]